MLQIAAALQSSTTESSFYKVHLNITQMPQKPLEGIRVLKGGYEGAGPQGLMVKRPANASKKLQHVMLQVISLMKFLINIQAFTTKCIITIINNFF